MPSGGSAHYRIIVLQRALDVLEVVAFSRSALGLQAVAARTGIPKPTCFRLLSNLEERGYVRRLPEGGYRVGSRTQLLADVPSDRMFLRDAARPEMVALRDRFGHTVSIAIRMANHLLYLDTVEGTQALRFVEPSGTVGPLHATALGKALVAACEAPTRQAIAASLTFEPLTENTVRDADTFLAELDIVQRQGFALDEQESVAGATCVAIPILDASRAPLAAVSVSAPAAAMSGTQREAIVAALAGATRRIAGVVKEGS